MSLRRRRRRLINLLLSILSLLSLPRRRVTVRLTATGCRIAVSLRIGRVHRLINRLTRFPYRWRHTVYIVIRATPHYGIGLPCVLGVLSVVTDVQHRRRGIGQGRILRRR